jgi:hypothetical protein
MNPSYCRIRVPKDDALRRFAVWIRLSQIGPLVPAEIGEAVRLACDERGQWRGNAVFVSELPGWTLFQDLSGALGGIPARKWLEFTGPDDLVFAGYNDAIRYGELSVVSGGSVVREFLDDADSPGANVSVGELDSEFEPIRSWVDVAKFVDADELGFSDSGWLWVYRDPA